jgi:hypothetical protein
MDRYEIRIAGHITRRRADSLGCDELRLLPGGDSLLAFGAVDQAALYGLLTRLRDAGLGLIAVERVPAATEPADIGPIASNPSKEQTHA